MYKFNKIKTAITLIKKVKNWPEVLSTGYKKKYIPNQISILKLRSGLELAYRPGTSDWNTILEILVAGEYDLSIQYIIQKKKPALVYDLGANIGIFSFIAWSSAPDVTVYSFEPAPPNQDIFNKNIKLNMDSNVFVKLHNMAISGESSNVEWSYDDLKPASSSLYIEGPIKYSVKIKSFEEIVNLASATIDLLKMDIEGSEYDILKKTPKEVWNKINAIALEIHDDPSGVQSREEFLTHMKHLGYKILQGSYISIFLTK
jgi:hypothetical protein